MGEIKYMDTLYNWSIILIICAIIVSVFLTDYWMPVHVIRIWSKWNFSNLLYMYKNVTCIVFGGIIATIKAIESWNNLLRQNTTSRQVCTVNNVHALWCLFALVCKYSSVLYVVYAHPPTWHASRSGVSPMLPLASKSLPWSINNFIRPQCTLLAA